MRDFSAQSKAYRNRLLGNIGVIGGILVIVLMAGQRWEKAARINCRSVLSIRSISNLDLNEKPKLVEAYDCFRSYELLDSILRLCCKHESHPDSSMIPGVLHAIRRDYAVSTQLLDSFLRNTPARNPVGWFWLGVGLANQGEDGLAAQAIQTASAEKYAGELLRRAIDQNNSEQVHIWLMVAAKTPEMFSYVKTMVVDYLAQGQRERALAIWQQFSDRIPPNTPRSWWALGLNANWQGFSERGLDYLEAALRASPKDSHLLDDTLSILLEMRDYGRALEVALQAAEVAHDAAYARFRVAQVYEKLGDYPNATHWLRLSQEKAPRWWVIYSELGVVTCAQKRPDFDKALAYFDQALELSPDQIYAMMARVMCLYQVGKTADAFANAETTIKKHGDDPRLANFYLMVGDWYLAEGKISLADSIYRRGQELWPEIADFQIKSDALHHPAP